MCDSAHYFVHNPGTLAYATSSPKLTTFDVDYVSNSQWEERSTRKVYSTNEYDSIQNMNIYVCVSFCILNVQYAVN